MTHSDLLTGPIVSTIIRLAIPNFAIVAIQIGLNVLDAVWIGSLGVEPLAGLSLAFPLLALVHMLSVGGMGSSVASVVARSVGSRGAVGAVVPATIIVSLAMAALFAGVMLGGGRAIYAAIGGEGETLSQALTYSTIVFAGVPAFLLFNMLANVFRGAGNSFFPSAVFAAGGAVHAVLSPALTFGWGALPRLGIAGPALSATLFYGSCALVLIATLMRSPTLRPSISSWSPIGSCIRSILKIGSVASVNTLQTNLAFFALTGFAASVSTAMLAGYGLCVRLEYLLNSLAFSIGQGMIAIVGACIAAGSLDRARRATFIGSLMAAALTGLIGLIVTVFPDSWLQLFTSDAAVRTAGANYFALAGPAYLLLGLGITLYSSCLAAGQLRWPFLANLTRLVVVAAGGWVLVRVLEWDDPALFIVAPAGLLLYAGAMFLGLRRAVPGAALAT